MKELYAWMKNNDLPNWLGLVFSLIIWPIVIYLWSKRKRWYIKYLTVSTGPGKISIPGNPEIPALQLVFTNNSNSTIFLANPRIKNNQKNFKIHVNSTRDYNTSYYELKFHDGDFNFNLDYKVLRTGEKAYTAIGLMEPLAVEFYKDRPNYLRRLFNQPKYFIFQYNAQVDNTSHQVKSTY